MKLLVSNMHLNPSKRHSVNITIESFNSLLDSLEIKDYKDIINSLMSATTSSTTSSSRSASRFSSSPTETSFTSFA